MYSTVDFLKFFFEVGFEECQNVYLKFYMSIFYQPSPVNRANVFLLKHSALDGFSQCAA